MQTISIGMMTPTSTIRPMGKDYDRAFRKSIESTLKNTDFEVEIFTEMIGQGSVQKIEEALDKFFGFHDVDCVTGIMSQAGIQNLTEKFDKKEKPLVCSNLGEHFPLLDSESKCVFQNSIHLWQQAWNLGYYAGSELGSRGSVIAAVYDSGYAFLPAFQFGLLFANPSAFLDIKLLEMPVGGGLSDVKSIFDTVDWDGSDFVFPLFCGEEATIFLKEFKDRGLNEKTQLLGLPFLLERGTEDLSGISVYTSSESYNEQTPDPYCKDVFAMLGNRAGKAIGKAIIKDNGSPKIETLNQVLRSEGNSLYQLCESPRFLGPIHILKNTFGSGDSFSTERLKEQEYNISEDNQLNELRRGVNSSWINPYLGI